MCTVKGKRKAIFVEVCSLGSCLVDLARRNSFIFQDREVEDSKILESCGKESDFGSFLGFNGLGVYGYFLLLYPS